MASSKPDKGIRRTDLEESVLRALNDPKWSFRTAEGIQADLGVDPEQVRSILQKLLRAGEVRVAKSTDPKGRRLYTVAGRVATFREKLADLRSEVLG